MLPISVPFPLKGLSQAVALENQPPLTTPDCQNVIGWDPTTGRERGASRPGLTKLINALASGANPIQFLGSVAIAGSGGSGRAKYNVVVVDGDIFQFTSSYTAAASGTNALSSSAKFVMGAELFGKIYLVDGTNYVKWDAATNTASTWTAATAGTLPSSGANKCRIIETWRGCIAMAGLEGDGHNWFLSALGDAENHDYLPASETEASATSGNSNNVGKCEDVITGLAPFTDDLMVIGCDHSLWLMAGHPRAGGYIDRISEITGMAFGQAWCKDPYGRIWFFGSRGGVFVLAPGEQPLPERKSQNIDYLLASVDLANTVVRMAWEDRAQCVHLWLTPTTDTAGTHWIYDTRTEAWWRVVYGSNGHQPRSVLILDGDAVGDRVLVLGGNDGYVRYVDLAAEGDDGTAISSYCYFGPILGPGGKAFRTNELRAQLATGSDQATLTWHSGDSVQAALAAAAAFSVDLTTASYPCRKKKVGAAGFAKIANSTLARSWQFESMEVVINPLGRIPGRRFR